MKKRNIFLIVFTIIILISVFVTTVVCARESAANVYYLYYLPGVTVTDTHCTIENDHVELNSVEEVDDIVMATFVPKSQGFDIVEFYTETSVPEQDTCVTLRFYSGPFGTIFSFNTLIDFKGSRYVICLFLLLAGVYAAVLLWMFVDYIRTADFGYPMVACGGFGLFFLHYFVACSMTFISSFISRFNYGFGDFLMGLVSSGGEFTRSIAAVMALFCAALVISNVSLIRHEGFRPQNLLGVMLGLLWLTGTTIYRFFYEQSFFGLSNAYAIVANALSVVLSYFECMLFSASVSAYFASRSQPPLDRDYVVILGCAIRKDGSLTPILKGRADAAISFAKSQLDETGRRIKYVPSGGQGADEVISEGEAMKRYLVGQGIDEQDILPEMKSINTYENIKLSKEIIENDTSDEYNAAFATTNYHVFRGYILSKKLGLKNARGISAKTKWYFFPNAFLRELVGLTVDKWKLHAAAITLIILVFTVVYILTDTVPSG